MSKTKGIILAGGNGSRLYPLTYGVSKQLLPVYDKPMIHYPVSLMLQCGIRDILIIVSDEICIQLFKKALTKANANISFIVQKKPLGLAHAFILGKTFIRDSNVCLMLGDNIFHGHKLGNILLEARKKLQQNAGAVVFGYQVQDAERYGVVEFDKNGTAISVEEKPLKPKSNYALTGLYFFDNNVVSIAKTMKPSPRGELEITDIITVYLQQKKLNVEVLNRGFAWLDTGTHKSLLEASQYVCLLEERQGLKVACLEEIAWRKNFISSAQLENNAKPYLKSNYGKYIMSLLDNTVN